MEVADDGLEHRLRRLLPGGRPSGPRHPALINKRELRRASASLGTSHSLLSAKLLKILTAILSSYVPY